MDYSKIRVLMMHNNFSERKLATEIGMSNTGFRTALERKTLRIDHLEKISAVFDVPVTYFFNESNEIIESKPGKKCMDCVSKDGKIELLTKMIKEKEEMIKQLHIDLGRNAPGKSGKVA